MQPKSAETSNFIEKPLELELRCPVDTQVLPVLRTVVTALACQMGFGQEDIEHIEMAVDEACANVIRHAYKHLGLSPDVPEEERARREDHSECQLWVRIRLDAKELRISVIDRGIGIKDQPKGYTSVKEFQEKGGDGGLGVYIIHNFMDEVEFNCPPGSGTILTMVKYLRTSS